MCKHCGVSADKPTAESKPTTNTDTNNQMPTTNKDTNNQMPTATVVAIAVAALGPPLVTPTPTPTPTLTVIDSTISEPTETTDAPQLETVYSQGYCAETMKYELSIIPVREWKLLEADELAVIVGITRYRTLVAIQASIGTDVTLRSIDPRRVLRVVRVASNTDFLVSIRTSKNSERKVTLSKRFVMSCPN